MHERGGLQSVVGGFHGHSGRGQAAEFLVHQRHQLFGRFWITALEWLKDGGDIAHGPNGCSSLCHGAKGEIERGSDLSPLKSCVVSGGNFWNKACMKTPVFVLAAWTALSVFAQEGWRPLFNGKDLSGWVPVQVAPNTFTVRDGIIVSTGVPTGVMRTDRQYENFELELEWKHIVPKGNAGLFVWSYPITAPGQPFTRSIEVQILDGRNSETHTSHGDIFSIHGARMKPDRPHPRGAERCLPSEFRCKPAGEWNHYRVVCKDGVIKLSVNGKEVSGGSNCTPRKGYICLESEGTECHFRNIRIKELPSSNPPADQVAPVADNTVSIYNGLNLAGWKGSSEHKEHWKAKDWILDYDGKCEAADPHLWTEKSYRDFVMICDWRWPEGAEESSDSGIYLRGNDKSQVNIWRNELGSGEVYGYRTDASMPGEVRRAVTPKTRADKPVRQWNRFVITMRGDWLTVELNGEMVIENAQLPGVPREGPIALQHHGSPIQFANIYIKELSEQ